MNDQTDFKALITALAAVGAQYPTDFLDSLSLAASVAAVEFMKAHGAPPELTEAIDMAFFLKQTAGWLAVGEAVSDSTLADVPETVTKLIYLTLALGGSLEVVGSTIYQGPLIAWEPLAAAETPAPDA